MELTQAQVLYWLGQFLWPFMRITGLMLTAPILSSSMIPNMVKSMLAALYAICMAGWLHNLPPIPADPFTVTFLGAEQIFYGALIGIAMQFIINAVSCAGEIASMAMSLSFSVLQFRDAEGSSTVLSNIYLWVATVAYITLGGPEWMFAAIYHSFDVGVSVAPLHSTMDLVSMARVFLTTAIGLALPVITITLCVNLSVGLTTVYASQMNLLSIGFPILILCGMWVLAQSVLYFQDPYIHAMRDAMGVTANIIHSSNHGDVVSNVFGGLKFHLGGGHG